MWRSRGICSKIKSKAVVVKAENKEPKTYLMFDPYIATHI
jgi:hypothetical protein